MQNGGSPDSEEAQHVEIKKCDQTKNYFCFTATSSKSPFPAKGCAGQGFADLADLPKGGGCTKIIPKTLETHLKKTAFGGATYGGEITEVCACLGTACNEGSRVKVFTKVQSVIAVYTMAVIFA